MNGKQRLVDDAARNLKRRVVEDSGRKEDAVDDNDMEVKRAAFLAMADRLRRSTEGREHTPAEELIREDRDRGHRPHLGF